MKNIGIDIAKDKHKACIVDENKKKLTTFNFDNSHLGLAEFRKRVSKYGTRFRIGVEATGVYYQGLIYHLKQHYENIIIVNPKRIKAHRKSLGYESKTDKIDAYIIADYVKERQLPSNIQPDKYPKLKQLCRTRKKLRCQQTRLKSRIKGDLHVIFPEYETCFDNVFCKASLSLLKQHTHPKEILALSEKEITKILRKGCKRMPLSQARKIQLAAKNSFGIEKEGTNTEIRLAIQNLELLDKQVKLLEKMIEQGMEDVFNPFEKVSGVTKISAAGIIAESGDINYFKNKHQYYNYTGLAPRFAQSGKFESANNRISKCGNSYLRYYIMHAALCMVRYNQGLKKIYYKKHFLEKKKKQVAYNCVAKKLCSIIFKLLKTKQYICPEKLAH